MNDRIPGRYLSPDRCMYNRLDFTMNTVDVESSVIIPENKNYKFFEFESVLSE